MIGLPYSHFRNPEAGPCPIWEATGRIHWILENHSIWKKQSHMYPSHHTIGISDHILYNYIYICIDQPTLSCNVGAKKSSAAAAATTTTTAATTTTFGSRKQHHWVWLVNFWFPFDPWLFSSNACCWSFLVSEELWIPWIPVFFCRSTLDYICHLKIHR